jgi:hypothetical protein
MRLESFGSGLRRQQQDIGGNIGCRRRSARQARPDRFRSAIEKPRLVGGTASPSSAASTARDSPSAIGPIADCGAITTRVSIVVKK